MPSTYLRVSESAARMLPHPIRPTGWRVMPSAPAAPAHRRPCTTTMPVGTHRQPRAVLRMNCTSHHNLRIGRQRDVAAPPPLLLLLVAMVVVVLLLHGHLPLRVRVGLQHDAARPSLRGGGCVWGRGMRGRHRGHFEGVGVRRLGRRRLQRTVRQPLRLDHGQRHDIRRPGRALPLPAGQRSAALRR